MAFNEKFIEELKQKNNIIDVVGRYCVLKRKGSNHWACCPLPGHSEKTPSFTVNEAGQFFKCFGCGRGGDVITFTMTMENLDYLSAVKLLCEQAKMTLPDDDRDYKEIQKARSDRDRLLSLMKTTALYYVHNLSDERAKAHNEYLKSRGIDQKTQIAFGIGASFDMFSLPDYLKKQGYTEEEMLKCGVCQQKTNDKGTYIFDAQYGRLIIPIINNLGNVIAFGGRVLENKPNFAKYKNTQETTLFIKNRTLYNINNLKKEKNLHGISSIIMVEGYMDTISVYQAGFKNVVASMGTSLTVEQARLLKRYADTVYISYDGDGAGQNATIRGLEILKNEGLEVKVVRIPKPLDPDDVIKKYGAEGYQKLLDESVPLIDFKLDTLKSGYNLSDVSEKRKYVAEALKIISSVSLESEREDLLRKLSSETNVTFEALKRDVEKGVVEDVKAVNTEKVAIEVVDAVKNAERFILCAMLFNKQYSKGVDLSQLNLTDGVHLQIAEIIEEAEENGKEIFPANLSAMFSEEDLNEYNAVLVSGDNVFGTSSERRYFEDCVRAVKKFTLEQSLKELNDLYKNETDTEKRKEIIKMIADVTAKLSR